jgi:hypothetical protein
MFVFHRGYKCSLSLCLSALASILSGLFELNFKMSDFALEISTGSVSSRRNSICKHPSLHRNCKQPKVLTTQKNEAELAGTASRASSWTNGNFDHSNLRTEILEPGPSNITQECYLGICLEHYSSSLLEQTQQLGGYSCFQTGLQKQQVGGYSCFQTGLHIQQVGGYSYVKTGLDTQQLGTCSCLQTGL